MSSTFSRTKRTRPAVAPKESGRKKSLLTIAGEEGAREAKRKLLLKTLKAHDWNLAATARALQMGDTASPVIIALQDIAPDEYAEAKAAGRVLPGRPK